ncbi:HAD-IIA family hydrolase [Candidatus Micrarchaeota archaeon]|nr:HAD-IIA family hydrolase [Candidatus Micrarchaeota archaeon]
MKTVIFDLDGTIFLGKTAIPGAREKIEELRSNGVRTLFLTNAGTRTRKGVKEKLAKMGFEINEPEIYTGAYSLARYLAGNHPGKKAYVVGETGLVEELENAGIKIAREDSDIVAASLDRRFTYKKLAMAQRLLLHGAVLVATNYDYTFPVEGGVRPGAGSIVAAIEAASGKKAISIGKPGTYGFELMQRERGIKREETMFVGDRIDTDIAFARNCGIRCALVLTGVSKNKDIKKIKPDYVFDSIADFTLP